jgi:hypothetical protein
MRYRNWLRYYATSRKVAGSIPDEVIWFFSWPNPSSRIMAMGSDQPLTEMSTRDLPDGKDCRLVRLTASPPPVNRLPRKCGRIGITLLHAPPRPVTGIALLFRKRFSYRRAAQIQEERGLKLDDRSSYSIRASDCFLLDMFSLRSIIYKYF